MPRWCWSKLYGLSIQTQLCCSFVYSSRAVGIGYVHRRLSSTIDYLWHYNEHMDNLGVCHINVYTYLFYVMAGQRLLSFNMFVPEISLGLPSIL